MSASIDTHIKKVDGSSYCITVSVIVIINHHIHKRLHHAWTRSVDCVVQLLLPVQCC